ncbi:MAG TPA: ELM1/GtrOC1 family putative glycosyltransferase [Thermohalobaculum sp.]|nr:ELM1/GtrOC1 family putative glycosyltransferase [Thermohalobaculum sp.]
MPDHDHPQRTLSADPGHAPVAWLLTDDRPGHRTQVLGLARLLGCPAVEKRLAFGPLNRLPNPLLGDTLLSLDRARSDPLSPPYPDLLIGMGRRVVPVARWIKRRSGGRCRIVLLGRKAASDPRMVDLAVACAHFRLLPHDRMVELAVPLTQIDGAALDAARAAHGDPLAALARPRVLLLAGGPTAQHRLEPGFAGRMASDVAGAAAALGGALAIVTSRRTPAAAVAAMREAAPEALVHAWRADRSENPYLAYLAAADLIVVTGESESMLAEAVAADRPVTIYPLVPRPESLKHKLAGQLRRGAGGRGVWASLCRALLSGGWIAPPRDLALMHSLMVARGQARLFDDGLNTEPPRAPSADGRLAERILALVGRTPEAVP